MSSLPPHDLVLSSGFLAFARQAGFLQAVEDVGLPVDGLCGTSSGALAGALWAAGLPAAEVARELSARKPWALMRLNPSFWRGAFNMGVILEILQGLLPPAFEDLPRPFAVGVQRPDGSHGLITEGPLPEAVAASCAMPWIFAPIPLACGPCQDGGAVDRLGLSAWRALRGPRPTVVHRVDRTGGVDVEMPLEDVILVKTPRSGARFWDLGDFAGQVEEARRLSRAALDPLARPS